MPVYHHGRLWPGPTVPYAIEPADATIEGWVQEINSALCSDFLVPRTAEDDYIEIAKGGGKSEAIGKKRGGGKQTVSASAKFSMQHEILHALGVAHEQLHRKYPWDDEDPALRRTDLLIDSTFSFVKAAKVEQVYDKKAADFVVKSSGEVSLMNGAWNVALYGKLRADNGPAFTDSNLRSRALARTDPAVTHWNECDFDSIMMYGEMRRAVEFVMTTQAFPNFAMRRSGHPPGSQTLSKDDVAVLRHMYPQMPPPRPPALPDSPAPRTFPAQHPLFDSTYHGLPVQRPVAQIAATPAFSFTARFDKAVKDHAQVAQASGLRIFILGATVSEVETLGVKVLTQSERFVSRGLRLKLTPLVVANAATEARVYYY